MASAENGWGEIPLANPIADVNGFREAMSRPWFYCPHKGICLETGRQVSTVGADGKCETCGTQVREPMVCGKRPA